MRRHILGVIPARFGSTRFPGKPLATFAGKTVIEHVYRRASRATCLSELVIATDDERIAAEARRIGARVRMTRAEHPSGTDRVAEVAAKSEFPFVVNIQGDEPLIDPEAIDAAVEALVEDEVAGMATLKKRIEAPSELTNPNVVKVVTDMAGRAVYFSRSPIPYAVGGEVIACKHIGLYVYHREFLLAYPELPVGPLEQAERLEQLRAIENGYEIRVAETTYESVGVDTPEDLRRVEQMYEESSTD